MNIAAFDSGIGGMTTIAPLLKKYSGIDVTYLGDIGNLPYGSKSKERIQNLTRKNLEWLFSHKKTKFDLAIIACNTASAQAIDIGKEVGAKYKIPVVGVIEAGCRLAVKTAKRRIVNIATSGTVGSRAYLQELSKLGCEIPTIQKACPMFVPLVEEGLQNSPAAEWVAKYYLDELNLSRGDTVILGCTHYPFLLQTLKKLYTGPTWIDPGASLVEDPVIQELVQKKPLPKTLSSLDLIFTDQSVSELKIHDFLKHLGLFQNPTTFSYTPALS